MGAKDINGDVCVLYRCSRWVGNKESVNQKPTRENNHLSLLPKRRFVISSFFLILLHVPLQQQRLTKTHPIIACVFFYSLFFYRSLSLFFPVFCITPPKTNSHNPFLLFAHTPPTFLVSLSLVLYSHLTTC